MKIDVTQKIVDLAGNELPDGTLRSACTAALLTQLRGDDNLDGKAKAKLFALAVKISENDEPDLSIDEWALIKERIGRGFPPLIVGRAYELIEPPAPRAVESA